MAELLSVQIHAPPMWAGPTTGTTTPGTVPGSTAAASVLKKVDNRTVQASNTTVGGPGTTLKHLQKRRPIDIEFRDLTYSVSEGRKRGSVIFTRATLCIARSLRQQRVCLFVRPSVTVGTVSSRTKAGS